MTGTRSSGFWFAGAGALAVALLALAGCTPGGTPLDEDIVVAGQPGGRMALSIEGTVPTAPVASVRSLDATPRTVSSADLAVIAADGTAQGTITLTDARISLKEFKFKRPDDDLADAADLEENDSVKLDGPFVVDLLTDTVTPEIPPIDVVAGTYTEIVVQINVIETEDEVEDDIGAPAVLSTDPMFGYSVYLAGAYTGQLAGTDVVDVPFVLAFDLDEEVTIAAGDPALGFVVDHNMLQTIIIAFRVTQWFDFTDTEANPDGFDFNSLTDDTQIVLDETVDGVAAYEDVRDVIKKKLEASADTGEDHDGDGHLDSDEDDDPPEEDAEDGTGSDGESDE